MQAAAPVHIGSCHSGGACQDSHCQDRHQGITSGSSTGLHDPRLSQGKQAAVHVHAQQCFCGALALPDCRAAADHSPQRLGCVDILFSGPGRAQAIIDYTPPWLVRSD